jgi:hypothetical protein
LEEGRPSGAERPVEALVLELVEGPQTLSISRENGRKHLQRDVTVEPRIARPVHLAHPACSQDGGHLVRSDACA